MNDKKISESDKRYNLGLTYLREKKYKDFFILRTKEYFRPLKSKWFWIIVITFSIIMLMIEASKL